MGLSKVWKARTLALSPRSRSLFESGVSCILASFLRDLTCASAIATEDLIGNARYPLDVASSALPAYEALFGLEMPLPKMDFLAVNESDVGAMENWVDSSRAP